MNSNEIMQVMNEMKTKFLNYLQDELSINDAALKSYDNDSAILGSDTDIRKIREIEAMKLRDRIHELNRHIAVIKRM